MDTRLTEATVKRLPAPAKGNRITYDPALPGFGVRVTAAGHRAFILTYWIKAGRQRRYTIGSWPDWSVVGARDEARKLKRKIDQGGDPLGEIEEVRDAPTVPDLIARFEAEHLPRKRPRTAADYHQLIRNHIAPALRHLKVAEVHFEHVDRLHQKITSAGSPYAANRAVAVISKMSALAIKWRWRTDNPARGIERNVEHKHTRYLTPGELKRLINALDAHPEQQAADVIRLLLLTGARLGEVLGARWTDIDLRAGTWTRSGSTTKQKTTHVAPLATPARELLAELRKATNSEWVFPAEASATGHRRAVNKNWSRILKAAKITDLRIHDLRHSFASQLASGGASLPLIGALLGHSNPVTTHRYAHLFDDSQRAAVERLGAVISNAGKLPKARVS